MKWLRSKPKKLIEKPLSGGLATSGPLDIGVHRAASAEKREEETPKLFRWLQYVEFALVVLIGTCVATLAVYTVVWIVCGCGEQIHSRVVGVVTAINNNWRVDLLVLIPLFFRPIFKFLFFLRKGPWGTESGQLPQQGGTPPMEPYKGEEKASQQ